MLTIITAVSGILSVIAVLITSYVAWSVYDGQKKLSQRQLIIPLWGYLSNIRSINPEQPISDDVIHLVNTLELVAICCEGGMVDEDVILRTFKDGFLLHAQSIMDIRNKIEGLGKNGEAILKENRAAYLFFNRLKDDDLLKHQLKK